MNIIKTTVAARWRRLSGAARFIAAAALVCAGAQAQAQSFYLDDVNLAPNIIRVNAAAGTPVGGITPRVISGSTTIQNNVTYSLTGGAGLFAVNAATGAIRSAGAFTNGNLGHYPVTLTATHGGETDGLPLTIGVHPVGGFYICDRTAPIRDRILAETADADVCNLVSTAAMAEITEVNIAFQTRGFGSGTLFDYDFWGMSGLQTFTAYRNNNLITSLSPDIFSNLDSLNSLILRGTGRFGGQFRLTEFSARLLADLERPGLIDFRTNLLTRQAELEQDEPRISGIRYYLDGNAVAEALIRVRISALADGVNTNRVFAEVLTLDEGVRHNFEIEVVGGVRSTLTLVLRNDSQSPVTVRPATIRIPPFSNRATAVLETPLSLDFQESQVSSMSWAWNQFDDLDRRAVQSAEEIRTPILRATVRDTSRFEDAAAAPNQISEAASPGDPVLGWSPQVLVRNVAATNVRYSLSSDAGGLFTIHATNGALSPASGRALNFAASTFHEVTVAAQVTVDGDRLTASLTVPIEVLPEFTLTDTNPSTSIIASRVAPGTPVAGLTPVARLGGSVVTDADGVMYSLDGPDGLFVVNTASGVISSARPFVADDIRAHPVTLTAMYNGAIFGSLAASLPLTIEVGDGFSICGRTRLVRNRILEIINSPEPRYDCNFVPSAVLASVGTLTWSTLRGLINLLPHDFNGMTGLENLSLRSSSLTSLPEDIFRDTVNLRVLNLGNNNLMSLPENIFRDTINLRVLNLDSLRVLTSLPENIFRNLGALENLNLSFSPIASLPEHIFRDTVNLRELNLDGTRLTSLPPDIFMNLNRLESLSILSLDLLPARLLADLEKEPRVTLGAGSNARIGGIGYRLDGTAVAEVPTPDVAGALALDEGVRHRLQVEVADSVRSTLTLVLRAYRELPSGVTPTTIEELPFTVTPTTIEFSPLSDANTAVVELMAQPDLDFADSSSLVSWAWQMFTPPTGGETEIQTQRLQVTVHNTETFFLEDADPSANTIAMSAAVGTRVAGVMPAARVGRAGGAVAATGAEYALTGSDLFTVNSASGVISLARPVTDGDRGRRPVTLTATYRNAAASLPLVISVLHADEGFDICGRTSVVRDEILRRVNEGGGTLDCTDVPAANLASVQTLDFSANPATVGALRADDFDGLTGLTGLNLRSLGLQSLPPDIFDGLAGLRMLSLQDSRLTSLPARLLAGLEKPDRVTAGFDAGVLIGGVQYRAGGEAVTELALDEGARISLRIEAAGGVRSTWTLVARTDGSPRPVVTPETIRFGPGADAAIVELRIPPDDNFDSSTGSVSWAWAVFNAEGAVNEIRTPGLRLDVRELERFEDIDPAPNQISETVAPGDPVMGWSPRVLARGFVPDGVRYRLSRDAGGLFGINSASGALSLAAGRRLDYRVSTSHQVTVSADVPGFGMTPLDATIEVRAGVVIEDADASPNIIAATAPMGAPVAGVALRVRFGARVLTDGVVYSLAAPGGLFTANPATGEISAARQLLDSHRGSHPITLTATWQDNQGSLPLTIETLPGVSICDRTSGVQDEILGIINSRPGGPTYNCHAVLPADLASITTLNLSQRLDRTSALRAHDFDGMAGLEYLNLRDVPLTSLPDGIFSGTTNLRVLNLGNIRRLTSLPPGIFGNLRQLENLNLGSLGATSLPENIFSNTVNLRVLNLGDIRSLTSLPPGIFGNLRQLENLDLGSIGATSLPENIFSNTVNLRVLNLGDIRSLTSLPQNIFGNLRQLENLNLSSIGATSLPENIFSNTVNLRVLNLGDIRSLTSLPQNIFGNLRQLENLNLGFLGATSLPENIFSNTVNLIVLNLSGSNLASLPPDILMNLGRLESLDLSATPLAELPARLLADLEKIAPRDLIVDADVRIGGIRYRAGGAPITGLTLNEGDSSNIQVEDAGNIRSTLTLVFQSSAQSRFTATPPTVQLIPSRRSVAVTLEVPVDPNLGDRSGPAQWVWRFDPADADEVAIPTALQVSVADTHRFEDTESAANQISEAASPGDLVSGWSPQVVVGGVTETGVSYRLSSDAGGLFAMNAANGALSLAPGQALDYATSPTHQVTVIARVTASGVTASLAAAIEVLPVLVLADASSLPNVLPVPAEAGIPVLGVTPQARHGDDILTDGVTYALTGPDLFTVDSASGAISAARQLTEGNTGDYPVTLTATHPRGLPGSLPLTIEVFRGVSVCERTSVIEDEIMRLLNSGREETYSCNFVPAHRLASITTLNFSGRLDRTTALQADDFAEMTGLEDLDLGFLGIAAINEAGLPEGLFSDLSSLRVLNLQNSRLMPLPPRLLADLERPPRVTAGLDAGVRIDGIQYLVDGTATTGPLTLDEGGRLSLRIRVVGGVHSTLTLAFRADGLPLVATPTAIEFGPLSNTDTAVVELMVSPDLNFADSGGEVFYVWEMFDAAAGGAAEIRAQSLRVNIRNTEMLSLEDADPAPNTIAVTATAGTNVAGVAPTVRVGGVVVTAGVAYTLAGSALFAVHSTSGAIFSASLLTDGNRGQHPVTLTASYRGDERSLPLTIGVHPAGGFDICDRTPLVQRGILDRVNTQAEVRSLGIEYGCAAVPTTRMASVRRLDFSEYSTTVETLLVHDFEGLSGLVSLNLRSLGLQSLPAAVFRNLANLDSLVLNNNHLAPLPPTLFRGLFRLRTLSMSSLGLQSLPPGIFRDLPNLRDLRLGRNNLAPLPRDVFSDLPNLLALDLEGNNLTSLPPDVFRNQPFLAALTLVDNNLTSLPPAVFSDLTNLYILELSGNANLVLPAQVVADLERQPLIALEMDRSVRIGGIQYRLDGAAITQLALNEGESRNLQIRVDGGVGSTLTLVARTDGAPPPAVTPTTVRFSPFSGTDTAVVELTARTDRNFDGSTGSVSWAWTVFRDFPEIRTQSLRLDVRDPDRFDDANPAPNQIGETAAAGDSVSGWSPQVFVGGATDTAVRYRLLFNPGGLFGIDAMTGALSLAVEGGLDYAASSAHQITVAAEVPDSGEVATLAVVIEVLSGLELIDADPSSNTIAAIVRAGTRVTGITPVVRVRSTVVTDGVMYSLDGPDLFAVNTTSGVIFAARRSTEDVTRAYPVTLTASHPRGVVSLPLVIEVRSGVFICDRTPEVRDGILSILNSAGAAHSCEVVPLADLASISTLNIRRLNGVTLLAHDFDYMPALANLSLASLGLTGLPGGIFRNSTNLRVLDLRNNANLVLPPQAAADLERLSPITLRIDRSARIGGIRYVEVDRRGRIGGIITELALNGGERRFLRVEESAGGVRSTLTLVARTDGAVAPTVTPATIRFSPLSGSPDAVVVELAAPTDDSFENSTASVSWAWTMFSAGGEATEIPTASLHLDVLELNRLEDTDPAPNRIGETASPGDSVSGWSPRVVVGGAIETAVRYSLLRDAGGLFAIDTATGALSPVAEGRLDHMMSSSHQVTVAAEVVDSGVTVTLEIVIEVLGGGALDEFVISDTDPAPNRISETASPGDSVSGWSPQATVRGVTETAVRYSLSRDAGGLFAIDAATGALSPVAEGRLDYVMFPSHQIAVVARATGSGATATLAATIEVTPGFVVRDADPSANIIAVSAAAGTLVEGIRPVARIGDAVLTDGVMYSLTGPDLFAVNAASGVISAARQFTGGDARAYPVTLMVSHPSQGVASLPLTITVLSEFSICDRTPVVQQEILRRVNADGASHGCSSVPAASLTSLQTLDFSGYSATVETLLAHDFAGLSFSLTNLNLRSLGLRRLPPGIFGGLRNLAGLSLAANNLTSLPPDIFSGLANLRALELGGNDNLGLPAQAAADLERSPRIALQVDRSARITGIQYLLDGAPVTELALNEGVTRAIRIDDGRAVRGRLTLFARTDGTPPPRVGPPVISFGPFREPDATVVGVGTLADDNFEGSTGSVSWAWPIFNATGEAAEIRTASLRLDVRDPDGLEDFNPAPNQISETASAGDPVTGWFPWVLVRGVVPDRVRYSLLQDAGGLFAIDAGTGALSSAAEGRLDYRRSSSHQIIVAAAIADSGVTATLTAAIEVLAEFSFVDADPSANTIAASAATGTRVEGVTLEARIGDTVLTDGVVYSLDGSDLFEIHIIFGVISAARQLMDSDAGAHPVTLTVANARRGLVDLPLNIEVLAEFALTDADPSANTISASAVMGTRVAGITPVASIGGDVLTDGVVYSLAGPDLFAVNTASGVISAARPLMPGDAGAYPVTLTASHPRGTASLPLDIEVLGEFALTDADPSANTISARAAMGTRVAGITPVASIGNAVVTDDVVYSLAGPDLFAVNTASGVISAARQLVEGDVGAYPVTLTASHPRGAASLPLDIEVLGEFALTDADPSANTISARAATGTQVAGIVLAVRGDADGVVYSLVGPDLFAVNTASGVISAARQLMEGDVGAYPVTLTASHSSGVARLPLVIEVSLVVSICDRTPAVRDEILRVLNSRSADAVYTCVAVPPDALASISTLAVPRQRVETLTLRAHDFDGMPALSTLTLAGLALTSLPEGVFGNTTNLRALYLGENNLASLPENIFGNLGRLEILDLTGLATTGLPEAVFSGLPNLRQLILLESGLTSLPPGIFRNLGMLEYLELSFSRNLTELPAPLLADLEKIGPDPVFLGLAIEDIETSRRIGGIRYRLGGATTTALTLNEGESRNLQVEVVGDIRSTLTLVFRASAASRFTATPPTIRLTPSRRTTDVTLTVTPDLNTGDRSGPVSFVWTSFLGSGVTELPAPDLRVSVRDTHRFDDTDPAPNRIGETAPAGVAVSGWSPRVLVGGAVETAVSYRLSSDAGGVFEIDTASGVLSLAPGQVLNHATTPTHEITVVAQAPSGTTASLAATIEVFTLALEDADPAPNTIAATAPPGTPVSGVQPVLLVDGAAVADGVSYTLTGSGLFTVHSTSGLISSAGALGGAAGSHPVTLTATYRGAPADLPLTIAVHPAAGFHICDRTPLVRDEILYRVNTQAQVRSLGIEYGCAAVPSARMASVQVLDFSRYSTNVETLRVDDFDGLSGLIELNLSNLGLRRLPPGVFSGLDNLPGLSLYGNHLTSLPPGIFSGLRLMASLSLANNRLTSLPPDVFSDLTNLGVLELAGNGNLVLPAQAVADLEGLRLAILEIDRSVRISGFQYHTGGRVPDEVIIQEGDSRDIRLEVPGGVRSTLTLVFRLEQGLPQFTVTPTTVRFSPFSNTDTAVVRMTAPADEEIDSVFALTSWAWTIPGNLSSAATEIRTQRLTVVVLDESGLVDTDPADNRISEAASPGDLVSGWSPQLVVDRVTEAGVRYRLSSNPGGLFQIHPTSGTLSLASGRMLDYETSTAHTVKVHGQASGGEWSLTTTLFVDEAPVLSLSGAVTGSISETAATGTVVPGIGVSLQDEGVPVSVDQGVDWLLSGSGVFGLIVADHLASLQLTGALDYEAAPIHRLTLRAEYLGESITTQITVHVLEAGEGPMLEAVGLTPYRIGEGALTGAFVGRVEARDDAGTLLTAEEVSYTVTGTELFAVTTAGVIRVAGQLDFEASTSHTLFITASHEGMDSDSLRVDIVVVDRRNDLQLVDQSSAENIASNTTGGQVRGLDLVFQVDGVNQAGAASAWTLSDGSGLFDINSATGVITLREPIGFAPADYDLFVGATWTGGDGVSRTPPPLPMNIEINDGIPVRIRVFLEGAVIP